MGVEVRLNLNSEGSHQKTKRLAERHQDTVQSCVCGLVRICYKKQKEEEKRTERNKISKKKK